ncbi:MAG: PEP-CTERM sorting domain-containing protein [Verrucomicrobiota bacterium]
MKITPIKLLCLVSVLSIPVASLNAAQVVDWTGNAGDGLWTTGSNWAGSVTSDVAPATGDTVNIATGSIVNTFGLAPVGIVPAATINLSGSSTLTTGGDTIRLAGCTVNVGSGSILTGGFWDLSGGNVNFKNGAIANMGSWQQKGLNTISFELGTTGFTTLTPSTFYIGDSGFANIINATYNVDMAAYTGGIGLITLMDFSTAPVMTNADFQTASLNILNSSGYTANLLWNETDKSIQLDVTAVPEPGTVALLGLGGLAMLRRRR